MDWNTINPILIDKAAIGFLLLLVGLWINRKLSKYKADLEEGLGTRVRIAEARLPAYKNLWELTSPTSPKRIKLLSFKERKALLLRLREWYYKQGQGIFLSEKTRALYFDSLKTLESIVIDQKTEEYITKKFSSLRSILKNEIGIYGTVSNYKYELTQDYNIKTDITELNADIKTDFIELKSDGNLTIKKGYAWNGPSGTTIPNKSLMRGSLVHNALYQLMHNNQLELAYRENADKILEKLAIEDGMSKIRARWIYRGHQLFAHDARSSSSRTQQKFQYEIIQLDQ